MDCHIAALLGVAETLYAVPRGPVELRTLSLTTCDSANLARLVAPRGLRAADLRVVGGARAGHPGSQECVCALELVEPVADDERTAVLEAIASHTRAHVVGFETTVRPCATRVEIWVAIPPNALHGSSVTLESLDVVGERFYLGAEPPTLTLHAGLHAPLTLYFERRSFKGNRHSPAISMTGELYVPMDSSPLVHAFASDGSPLPPLNVEELGFTSCCVRAAAVDDASGTLILACNIQSRGGTRIVALDIATRKRLWAVDDTPLGCFGLAVIPGVTEGGGSAVAAASGGEGGMVVFSVRDGAIMQRVNLTRRPLFVACDPSTLSLYMSPYSPHVVEHFVWEGAGLVHRGRVEEAGDRTTYHPLAVMPPAPGKRVSHLLVADMGTPRLLVLALPSHTRVHECDLQDGMCIVGIAADPSGTALAVCFGVRNWASADSDSKSELLRHSDAVRVFAWPQEVPGLPELK